MAPTPQKRPPKLPLPRVDTRTPNQIVAHDAFKLMRSRVEPELTGPDGKRIKSYAEWCGGENARVAQSMAAGGMTAEEIDEAHRAHSEARGRAATMRLRFVQDDMLNAHASRKPDPTDRLENVIPRPDVLDRMIPGDI